MYKYKVEKVMPLLNGILGYVPADKMLQAKVDEYAGDGWRAVSFAPFEITGFVVLFEKEEIVTVEDKIDKLIGDETKSTIENIHRSANHEFTRGYQPKQQAVAHSNSPHVGSSVIDPKKRRRK